MIFSSHDLPAFLRCAKLATVCSLGADGAGNQRPSESALRLT
jgi:hypothetical protein